MKKLLLTVSIWCMCLNAFAQFPNVVKQILTTNHIASPPADGWILTTSNGIPLFEQPSVVVLQTNFIAYSTNFYITDTTVSNYFLTQVFTNVAVSNYFATFNNFITTNQIVTNTYITNYLVNSTTVVSNLTIQEITTNSYVSNFFQTNIFNAITQVITNNDLWWQLNPLNGSITNVNGGGVAIGPGTNGAAQVYFMDSSGTFVVGGFDTNTHVGFFGPGYADSSGPADSVSVAVSGPGGHIIYTNEPSISGNQLWTNSSGTIGIQSSQVFSNLIFSTADGVEHTNLGFSMNSIGSPLVGDLVQFTFDYYGTNNKPAAVYALLELPIATAFASQEAVSYASYFRNATTNTDSTNWVFGGDAAYAHYGQVNSPKAGSGAGIGSVGIATSLVTNQAGMGGYAQAGKNSQTNLGAFAVENKGTRTGGANVGQYVAIITTKTVDPVFEDSVNLWDNWASGLDLLHAKSNNVAVFKLSSAGDLTLIKQVPYSWPIANTGGVLSNDSSGNLTWIPVETIITNNSFTTVNATTITNTTNVFNVAKGGNLIITNTISYITNTWPQGPTGIVQVATNYVQNLVSLTACQITGISGKTANQLDRVHMTFQNTSSTNWVLTVPASFVDLTGFTTHTVSNGLFAALEIEFNPGIATNIWWYNGSGGGGSGSGGLADFLWKTNSTTGGMSNAVAVVPIDIGTNATSGLLRIDGFGQLTQYSTNAGVFKLYNANTNVQVNLDGSTGNATMSGLTISTNGFASYANSAVAPTSITFPGSTVNWTNTTSTSILLYIDNSGVTGTVLKKNNTQIFSSLVGDMTIGLKPGDYFSETYTLGSPAAKYEVFP